MVFCKECTYFAGGRLGDCDYPDNLKGSHDWRTQWKTHSRLPKYINKDNKCEWFEKRRVINGGKSCTH